MSHMESNNMTAKTTNIQRQPIQGSSHCTGRVEANIPKEPVINIQELARCCLSAVNQRR
jgi:hypothetical protein